MPFALTKDHFHFFYRNYFLECEGIFTPEEIEHLSSLFASESEGYNLWEREEKLKSLLLRRSLTELASHLSKQLPLRLGSDRLLTTQAPPLSGALTRSSAVQPIAIAALFPLSSFEGEEPLPRFFPSKPGNLTFFSPSLPLQFPTHFPPAFIVTYLSEPPLYLYEPKDPYNHCLKAKGYAFGDRLRKESHPIAYQR